MKKMDVGPQWTRAVDAVTRSCWTDHNGHAEDRADEDEPELQGATGAVATDTAVGSGQGGACVGSVGRFEKFLPRSQKKKGNTGG